MIVVRAVNIFGPGDLNFSRLIPKTILRLLLNLPPVINGGNAHVLREYIFVDDVVNAYLFLAEHLKKHYRQDIPQTGRATYGWAAYNIGSSSGRAGATPEESPNVRSVIRVIDQVRAKLERFDLEPIVAPRPTNFIEIPNQHLDSSKIMRLGFQIRVAFEDGLDRAVEWYRKHMPYLVRLGYGELIGD